MISIHNIAHIQATPSEIGRANWLDLTFIGAYDTDVPTTITLYFEDPDKILALCHAINRAMQPVRAMPEPIDDEVPF